MSVYCMYCGKVLTTGDRIDRCFPDCNVTIFSAIDDYKQTLQEPLDRIIIERDQLKAENEKFRETLQKLQDIPLETYTLSEISDIAILMHYIAKQALKEVTK